MTAVPASAAHRAQTARTSVAIALTLAAMFAFAAMDGLGKVLARQHSIAQMLWVRSILFTVLAVVLLRPTAGRSRARRSSWRAGCMRGTASGCRHGRPWRRLE